MLYFIPAWYQGDSWNEHEEFWYKRREKSEFDETIKQLQLFRRNMKMENRILLLAYAPNFRHFLYRQGLFRASYWSCFDAIAQVEKVKFRILSYHDLVWPEGVEFVYAPYAMNAYINGKKYARVDFGENGNFISIDMFRDDQLYRRNIYDDRGFVSSSDFFEDGVFKYKDFFMSDGTRKLRLFMSDGHVEINPSVPNFDIEFNGKTEEFPFSKMRYASLGDVIEEVFAKYLEYTMYNDVFCVAMHQRHIPQLNRQLIDKKYIVTFFENRFAGEYSGDSEAFLDNARYIVTDTKVRRDEVVNSLNRRALSIRDISPYDTRLDLGVSNQLKVLNILAPIDGLSDEVFIELIKGTTEYLKKNDKARVHLLTKRTSDKDIDNIYAKVREVLATIGVSPELSRNVDEEYAGAIRNNTEFSYDSAQRFFVDVCVEEVAISRCLSVQRILLDLRGVEDVFLYVSAISKGVPRIGIHRDKYLEDKVNGLILEDTSQICQALSFYLDNFENWNAGLIGCYEVGKKYSTELLIESWKEVIRAVE